MRAPQLNRLLSLEEEALSPDGAGGFTRSYRALGQLWAALSPGSGSGVDGEEQLRAATRWRITLRAALPGSEMRPRAGQRLREESRIFHILAVAERDQDGRYLTCFCSEEVKL